MNINILRSRRWAVAIALLVLSWGTPSRAWCASANLWLGADGVESYTSKELKKSGMPTPIFLSSGLTTGLAFDKSHNLWAVLNDDEVVRYTAAQLKDLKKDSSPTPAVIITSASSFSAIVGCAFDRQGNLWVADFHGSIDELSKAQLAAGSGDVTPAIEITSSALDGPWFLKFDAAGNAWADSSNNSTLVEFSASQLTSSGSESPMVVLSDDGSGTSLEVPGEIAFDKVVIFGFPTVPRTRSWSLRRIS